MPDVSWYKRGILEAPVPEEHAHHSLPPPHGSARYSMRSLASMTTVAEIRGRLGLSKSLGGSWCIQHGVSSAQATIA